MAKELLPGQELYNGRYTVVKTLTFGEEGGVYTIRDTETRTILLLKEVIPPPSMEEEEIQRRVELLNEALLILTQFEHPNLSRIYLHFAQGRRQYVVMERIEGITLKTLLEMSVKPLPEAQVLRWAMDLADALHYLHDRPQPFIFDVIEPTHIMMTPEEELKLINYGLDRFFLEERVVGFTSSREQLAEEMKRFGETLVFLLTRKPPGPYGLTGDEKLSEELVKVLNRLLMGDPQRTFASYDELKKAFDKVLNPPPAPTKVYRGPQKPWVRLLNFNRMFEDALWAFLKQPVWLVAVEFLALLGLAGGAWYLTHPPVHPREGPAAYVACGREIHVIKADDKKLLSRLILEYAVSSLAATPDGGKLFAAAPDFSRLYLLNTRSNRVVGAIQVERNPQRLFMDPLGGWLYVLHPTSGQIGFVQVSPEKLPLDAEQGVYRPRDSMVGVFAAGPEVAGVAIRTAASQKAPEAAEASPSPAAASPSPAASPATTEGGDVVFASSTSGNRITGFRPSPLEILSQADVEGPGPVAISADGRTLYVAQKSTAHILTYDTAALREGPKILDAGGTSIQDLMISPDGKELWVVNGSGTIGVVNLADRKLRATVKLPGSPSSAFWRTDGKDAEIWVSLESTNSVVVVNPVARSVKDQINVGRAPTDVWVVP